MGNFMALERLFAHHRNYLRQVVDLRLEPSLRKRVDPSDIVQETLSVASQRIEDFLEHRPIAFRIWLRQNVIEQLIDVRRRHYAQKRDARRDIPLGDNSSMAILGGLLGAKASEIYQKQELLTNLYAAIGKMSELDRDILLMRHVEGLTCAETAEALAIQPKTASKRYTRAIRRLSKILSQYDLSES